MGRSWSAARWRAARSRSDVRDRASGDTRTIAGIDLLIAGDGRYSLVRQAVLGGPEVPHLLDVCLFRLLFPAGPDCPIDDYGQWFNGSNRLLAFRVPGDLVYCAGSFPIPPGSATPERMKTPEVLDALYRPAEGGPSREAAYLIDAVVRHAGAIHWARLQEGSVTFSRTPGVLLVGDAAHPMVPTLGQGATQACEDALRGGGRDRRRARGRGALGRRAGPRSPLDGRSGPASPSPSRATPPDTMLAGADPVAGTLRKCGPEFQRKLMSLYREIPRPRPVA